MNVPADTIEESGLHCRAAAAVLSTAAEFIASEAHGDDHVAQLTVREIRQMAQQVEEIAETLVARARMKAQPAEVISFGRPTPGDAS